MSSRRPRRCAAQWQQLIQQQTDSGLSAKAFCEQGDIVYQSFMNWRRRLRTDSPSLTSSRHNSPPAFVELTTPQRTGEEHAHWIVELDLGFGLQLRIAQAG